jgi:hypothetical protein
VAEQLAIFDDETAKYILQAIAAIKDKGLLGPGFGEGTKSERLENTVTNSLEPTLVYNDSGSAVPAYGLMQMTTTLDEENRSYVKVKQPIDSTLLRCPLLINGPTEIEIGGYGMAQPGPVYRLLHDGGTYVAGDRLGAKIGTFTATYGALYSVIGADAIDSNVVRVMFDTSAFYGKTKAGGLTAATPANVYFVDADGTVTSREYLAETKISNIAGDTLIALIPMYGRLFASEIC